MPERHLNNGQTVAACVSHASGRPAAGEHVVHVGTGTGYYTAIFAHLVGPSGRVTAIEYDPELAANARACLAPYPNVTIVEGDGAQVLFDAADVIYVNAGCTRPAARWLDNLADGGRLILPMTSDKGVGGRAERIGEAGAVFRIERRGEEYRASWISPVAIIPCAGNRDETSERALADAFATAAAGKRSRGCIAIRRFPKNVAGFAGRIGVLPTIDRLTALGRIERNRPNIRIRLLAGISNVSAKPDRHGRPALRHRRRRARPNPDSASAGWCRTPRC